MKNYNEIIKSLETLTLETLKTEVENYNAVKLVGIECTLNEKTVKDALETINNEYADDFAFDFVSMLEVSRSFAFGSLISKPTYKRVVYTLNSNGTFTLDDSKTAVFKFADLEAKYQLFKSESTNKKGERMPNKAVTIFGSLRFETLVNAFIRNCFVGNVSVEGETLNISRIKVDNKPIFEDDNGKTFNGGSNSALERQANALVKFFDVDVKLLKKDLPPLKLSAQKVKTDKDNKTSIKESKYLKFVDVFFSVMSSRHNNENVKIFLNDGTEAKPKATAETETATAETVTE